MFDINEENIQYSSNNGETIDGKRINIGEPVIRVMAVVNVDTDVLSRKEYEEIVLLHRKYGYTYRKYKSRDCNSDIRFMMGFIKWKDIGDIYEVGNMLSKDKDSISLSDVLFLKEKYS